MLDFASEEDTPVRMVLAQVMQGKHDAARAILVKQNPKHQKRIKHIIAIRTGVYL